MEQGVLAAAPPVCASEDYMMRKPPHQRNRGDSNCKESLSARTYYIKRIYQRGIFSVLSALFLHCFAFLIVFRITKLGDLIRTVLGALVTETARP